MPEWYEFDGNGACPIIQLTRDPREIEGIELYLFAQQGEITVWAEVDSIEGTEKLQQVLESLASYIADIFNR